MNNPFLTKNTTSLKFQVDGNLQNNKFNGLATTLKLTGRADACNDATTAGGSKV